MSLQGQIEEMGLGAIIQTLSLNRYRGTLRVESDEAGSQFFFISEGEIVLVRQVRRDPVRMGDLLVRAGKVSEADLEEALIRQKDGKKRLGEVLADMGLVTAQEIDKVIRSKFEEEFLDLFLLDKGRFEFIFGLTPEALFSPEEKLERVTLNTSGLMLEAMRRIDEWQDMIRSLGSLDSIYTSKSASIGPKIADYEFKGVNLPSATRVTLFQLLDGAHTLRDVLVQAIRDNLASRLETFQYLHALRQNELVKPLEFKPLLQAAKTALEAGDVPGAAKYIRAVLGLKGQLDIGLLKRYLGFLKRYQRPRLAFDEARLFAAACLARDDTENAIALYEEALSLEFKSAEVLDRLFYALLRANRRDRAIEVGLRMRDYLASDEALASAARITNNLKELDPDNAEIIELGALVLKRQERNEEAIKELTRALERAPADSPRRLTIVQALVELQPERADLKGQQAQLEAEAQARSVAREARRRVLVAVGVFLALIVAWRVWCELRARASFAEARAMVALGIPDASTFGRAIGLLQDAIGDGLTTVSGDARALKGEVEQQFAVRQRDLDAANKSILDRERAEDAKRAEEDKRRARFQAFEAGLQEFRRLTVAEDWPGASTKALALAKDNADLGDPRLQELAVFVVVTSTPSGAEVLRDGEPAGVTPRAVAVPVGARARLALHLRGHKVVEETFEGTKFQTRAFALEPGPTWVAALEEPPLPTLAPHDGGVVVASPAGVLRSLTWRDGRPSWTYDVKEALKGAGAGPPLTGLTSAGPVVVATSAGALAAVACASGQSEWAKAVPGEGPLWVTGGKVAGTDAVIVVRGAKLLVLDAASGNELKAVTLAAVASHPPAVGDRRAYVLLKGGSLVAIDLTKGGGQVWEVPSLVATAPPTYSEFAQAVLVREAELVRHLSVVDGRLVTTLEPQVGQLVGVAAPRERLYALGETGQLAVIRVSDGQLLVRATRVSKSGASGPVATEQEPFVADAGGDLLQLTASGRTRARVPLGGTPTAPLVAAGARIVAVVGARVLCVEPLGGE